MMLKLVDTSQKFIILGIFILDKVTRLRALLDPPPPQDGVSEFTGRYPLPHAQRQLSAQFLPAAPWIREKAMHNQIIRAHEFLLLT